MLSAKNIFFYYVKPLVPRPVQLSIRRYLVNKKRKISKGIWPINEAAANPPPGWQGWPDKKQFALILHHDVDTKQGHDSCRNLMDLEEKLGVRSTFFVVPERYRVSMDLLQEIKQRGFGLGVHGLKHDGKLFISYKTFTEQAEKINGYLSSWDATGFSSPSMIRRNEWMHHLDIEYSTSTFDVDPFEPQPEPANTIFPFFICNDPNKKCFIEMPYTLPQDFTLFVLMREKTIDIWKNKLDWIAKKGGMALVNSHPDYMNFKTVKPKPHENYPVEFYRDFILYVKDNYKNMFWNPVSKQVALFINQANKGA